MWMCLDLVLRRCLGYKSLNNSRYKFYNGRYYTSIEWQGMRRLEESTRLTQKYQPEVYEKQLEQARFLMGVNLYDIDKATEASSA